MWVAILVFIAFLASGFLTHVVTGLEYFQALGAVVLLVAIALAGCVLARIFAR